MPNISELQSIVRGELPEAHITTSRLPTPAVWVWLGEITVTVSDVGEAWRLKAYSREDNPIEDILAVAFLDETCTTSDAIRAALLRAFRDAGPRSGNGR